MAHGITATPPHAATLAQAGEHMRIQAETNTRPSSWWDDYGADHVEDGNTGTDTLLEWG